MKITIQITVESNECQLNVAQEVAHLDRGTLRPETLGLTLAEARSILAGIEQTVVEQQAAEFIAQQWACSHCGHERSCKGRHHIVFRTPFGKLRLESQRLYRCQCESDVPGRRIFEVLRICKSLRFKTQAPFVRDSQISRNADEPGGHILVGRRRHYPRSPNVPEPPGRASSGLVPHFDEADGNESASQKHRH